MVNAEISDIITADSCETDPGANIDVGNSLGSLRRSLQDVGCSESRAVEGDLSITTGVCQRRVCRAIKAWR